MSPAATSRSSLSSPLLRRAQLAYVPPWAALSGPPLRRRSQLACALPGAALAIALVLRAAPASATDWTLVEEGTPLAYAEGTATPDPSWVTPAFAEGAEWIDSAAGFGIGFGDNDDRTVLTNMINGYLTVYVRSHFVMGPEAALIQFAELRSRYDDGFVAYLNGVEICRANLPAGPLQATDPASLHEVTDGDSVCSVDPALFVEGDNVLAVEVHNASIGSTDLSYIPTLTASDLPPSNVAITRGPFVQQVTRTSALVVWETASPARSALAYGSTPALGQLFEDNAAKTHHVAALTGLVPSSTTYYQVISALVPSKIGRITTEVDRATPYRVVAYGDTRTQHAIHAQIIESIVPFEPAFALLSGDLVSSGTSSTDWDTFFALEADLIRDVPLYPTLGNHEADGVQYLDIFELPESSPSEERYYAVRYGSLLAISLDQYGSAIDAASPQVAWLDQTLAAAETDPDVRLRVVELHHGPYDSGTGHGSNLEARTVLSPIFEAYGVDIVFSGHNHDYERSTVNGVKYVVTGGGGAPLHLVTGDWWTEASASEHHYCILDIEGARLDFQALGLDHSVIDAFTIGGALNECAQAADCTGQVPGDCPIDEWGSWRCVEGACIWNCVYGEEPPPEGGAGGVAGAGGSAGAGGVGVGGSVAGAGGVGVGGSVAGAGGVGVGGSVAGAGGVGVGGSVAGAGGVGVGGSVAGAGGVGVGGGIAGAGGSVAGAGGVGVGGGIAGAGGVGVGGSIAGAGGAHDGGAAACEEGDGIHCPRATGGACGCAVPGRGRADHGWLLLAAFGACAWPARRARRSASSMSAR